MVATQLCTTPLYCSISRKDSWTWHTKESHYRGCFMIMIHRTWVSCDITAHLLAYDCYAFVYYNSWNIKLIYNNVEVYRNYDGMKGAKEIWWCFTFILFLLCHVLAHLDDYYCFIKNLFFILACVYTYTIESSSYNSWTKKHRSVLFFSNKMKEERKILTCENWIRKKKILM